jgi:catalase
MEGFAVHTFLVKFHWKPVAGVHSLVWEEAQIVAGCDPDFRRRDMADGIEAGAFLEYEFGIQVMPDDGTDSFEGIDLLDPTKLVPEELAPVATDREVDAESQPHQLLCRTEQVAFHTGNLVPGIEPTNDPPCRPGCSHISTRRSPASEGLISLSCPSIGLTVNDMLREGMHQTAIHTGVAPYHPNSIDGDELKLADQKHGGCLGVAGHADSHPSRSGPCGRRPTR